MWVSRPPEQQGNPRTADKREGRPGCSGWAPMARFPLGTQGQHLRRAEKRRQRCGGGLTGPAPEPVTPSPPPGSPELPRRGRSPLMSEKDGHPEQSEGDPFTNGPSASQIPVCWPNPACRWRGAERDTVSVSKTGSRGQRPAGREVRRPAHFAQTSQCTDVGEQGSERIALEI